MYIHVKPEDCHEIIEKTGARRRGDRPPDLPPGRRGLSTSGGHPLLQKAAARRAGKLRYRATPRTLRSTSPRAATRALKARSLRDDGRGDLPGRSSTPVCAGAAAAASPPGASGTVRAARRQTKKYIVCNGDEGDPGAFMDRSIMEGNPHAVLEGMMIAGLRHREQTRAISMSAPSIRWPSARLKTAIDKAEELGLLGDNILGTDFSFRHPHQPRRGRVRLRRGQRPDRVHRGQARHAARQAAAHRRARSVGRSRPSSTTSRPSPTSALILRNGADWYRSIGTRKQPRHEGLRPDGQRRATRA